MKSMFEKGDRMKAYAYALSELLLCETDEYPGICYYLRNFLQEELEYDIENFFFCDCKNYFPELWKERTCDSGDVYFEWFNNKEERIQALRNILKSN